MKSILIANQKGGVGKTTIADELAFALEEKYKVAFVNLDNQGGAVHESTEPNEKEHKYAVIDSPGALTENFKDWCEMADLVLIPTTPSFLDLGPLESCAEVAVRNGAKVGVVINMFEKRASLDNQFVEMLEKSGYPIYGIIPRSTVVKQAQAMEMSVKDYKKNHKVTEAFKKLAKRVVKETK